MPRCIPFLYLFVFTACTTLIEPSDNKTSDPVDIQDGIQGACATAKRPADSQSTGFFVTNGRLYDKSGSEFVIRGVNNPHAWFDSYERDYAYNALDAIAGHGFNSVRIVWETKHSASDLRRVIARVIELVGRKG